MLNLMMMEDDDDHGEADDPSHWAFLSFPLLFGRPAGWLRYTSRCTHVAACRNLPKSPRDLSPDILLLIKEHEFKDKSSPSLVLCKFPRKCAHVSFPCGFLSSPVCETSHIVLLSLRNSFAYLHSLFAWCFFAKGVIAECCCRCC